jgi:hypothetical protein
MCSFFIFTLYKVNSTIQEYVTGENGKVVLDDAKKTTLQKSLRNYARLLEAV